MIVPIIPTQSRSRSMSETDSFAALQEENARLVAILEDNGIAWRLRPASETTSSSGGGRIIRLNDKTVTLQCGQQQWRVAYCFLHRVVESDAIEHDVLALDVGPQPEEGKSL